MTTAEQRLRNRASKRRYKRERIEFIRDYKISQGCSVCGYNKCGDALEFDHINREDKKFSLSSCGSRSWEAIHEEIKKCVLLCANCHREKTSREKDYMVIDFEEQPDPPLDLL